MALFLDHPNQDLLGLLPPEGDRRATHPIRHGAARGADQFLFNDRSRHDTQIQEPAPLKSAAEGREANDLPLLAVDETGETPQRFIELLTVAERLNRDLLRHLAGKRERTPFGLDAHVRRLRRRSSRSRRCRN